MKILLLGKNGQVGWELQRSLQPLGEVIAVDRHSTEACGDIEDLAAIANTVATIRPAVIVNAAAHTAVDKAETEPDKARRLNALAPEVLAKCAEHIGAWLIHYSTDYVFDGSGQRPWTENDATGPLNVYGTTKLEGERLITSHTQRHLIFRTSWVYAARGGNFAKTMLRLAGERDQLNVINDQFGAPTSAELLADVTAHAIRQVYRVPETGLSEWSGIYHLAASGVTSWHAYAQFVLRHASASGSVLRTRPDKVQAISSGDFPTPAKRPGNSRLLTQKLQDRFDLHLPPWETGVSRMLTEIL